MTALDRAVAAAETHLPGVPRAVIRRALCAALPITCRNGDLVAAACEGHLPLESEADSRALHPVVEALIFASQADARLARASAPEVRAVIAQLGRAALIQNWAAVERISTCYPPDAAHRPDQWAGVARLLADEVRRSRERGARRLADSFERIAEVVAAGERVRQARGGVR